MGRFKARELRNDASPDEVRRQLNEIQKEIAADLQALAAARAVTEVQIGDYTARYGDVVRMAPPSSGGRLILPPRNPAQPNARVTLVVVSATGAVTAEAVDATVNGADSVAFAPGLGTAEFVLTPDGWSVATIGLVDAVSGLASTSIVYDATTHTFQRAPLTGEVTAGQNGNATTVTRSTNFQTSPWTGTHQFNGEVRDGTLHTEPATTGALNITLTAGATRLLIQSTGDITLGTISGCADGRRLVVEHLRSSGSGLLTVTHDTGTDAVSVPSSNPLVLGNRDGIVLEGRGTNWKMAGYAAALRPAQVQPESASATLGLECLAYTIRVGLSSGGTSGTADDVTVYSAAAPRDFRIIDCWLIVSTAVVGSTVQLRTASAGGGSALSSALSSGATGTARNNDTATRSVSAGGSVFVRRSDRSVTGSIYLLVVPI